MTWYKNLLIIVFLLIQTALPLRGFMGDPFESRGDFSWKMYAFLYKCDVQYRLNTPLGETIWPDHLVYFKRKINTAHVFYRPHLPGFHRLLCEEFRRDGKLGTLNGSVICSADGGRPWEIVDRNVDLCTAENFGVKEKPTAFIK